MKGAWDQVILYIYSEILAQREKDCRDRLVGHIMNLLNKFNNQDLHDLQIGTGSLTSQEIVEKLNV